MSNLNERLEYWLREILTLPTAPFHEEAIRERIGAFAAERDLKLRGDRAGNLVVEYRRGEGKPAATFTSHMDHPGFEVVSARGKTARLRLLGGVDEPTLTSARIVLYGADGPVRGRVTEVKMSPDRRKSHTHLQVACEGSVRTGDWGHFDLVPLSLAGGKIRSRALDNVMSVALILALLDYLSSRRIKAHVYGVFTAAEEVGFVGALELVKGRLLPKKVPVVVLETSRELPGFKIGLGPVVRVGDRLGVYDDHLTRWLSDTAEGVASKDPEFRFQRALMPGGMCEATLFQLDGWRACALALPLANYHNMGPRGAAAEWVNRNDAEQLLQLLTVLATSEPTSQGARRLRERLERQHRRYARRFGG